MALINYAISSCSEDIEAGVDCRQGRVRSGWMFVGLLLLSRSTLCCWLGAGCLAVWLGFAKESEDPFARGALKVAALSSSDQLGFFFSLLQIESRQGFIGLSVPRMTLLLSYLCSLPCYSLHFLSHSGPGRDSSLQQCYHLALFSASWLPNFFGFP